MIAFAHRHYAGSSIPFLARAALAVVALLLTAWIAWVALFTALIAVPVVAAAALATRMLRRRRVSPERPRHSDGPVIDGEYRIIPPER